MLKEAYLDNAATTRTSPEAAQAALTMMTEQFGNPSSLHHKGIEAHRAVREAHEQVAKALGCGGNCIYFTSGGTEANNLAIFGGVDARRRRGNKLVVHAAEHSSVLGCASQLAAQGYEVVLVRPEKNGVVDPEKFAAAVDENTIFVSCMSVNSETGAMQPVAQIAALVKRKNSAVLFHCDHVQGYCKIPLCPERAGIDLLSASAHKIHAVKGTGFLYVAPGVNLHPRAFGGSQENAVRPGTENTAGICAMGVAAERMAARMEQNAAHYRALRARLLSGLAGFERVSINSPEDGAPYILNISVPGIRSQILLNFLSQRGIYVSSGSACSGGAKSHVLAAMGLPDERIDSAIRISLCQYTTAEEIDAFLEALEEGMNTIIRTKK